MPTFLVESYLPRSRLMDAQALGREAGARARELSGEGADVRYVRLTLLPDDETCFHVFEAASADIVAEVCRRAGIGWGRIVSAVE